MNNKQIKACNIGGVTAIFVGDISDIESGKVYPIQDWNIENKYVVLAKTWRAEGRTWKELATSIYNNLPE